MLTKKFFYFLAVLVLIAILVLWQVFAYKVPESNYRILKTTGNIEVRDYPALLIAQIEVAGDRYAAINKGFKILADYIFGGNREKNKIAMTAPVIQQGADVLMATGDSQTSEDKIWHIRFIMPAAYTIKNLPQPTNSAIAIVQIPEKQYVVIRFSGSSSQENLSKHENALKNYISANKLAVRGQPIYAFYNPPWILPFLRRNEILFELKTSPSK